MAVELPFQPDGPADAHAADQPPDPVAQNIRALQRFFDAARITRLCKNLADRRPFRPLDAMRAIPFRIFCNHDPALIRRDRPRAAHPTSVLLPTAPHPRYI